MELISTIRRWHLDETGVYLLSNPNLTQVSEGLPKICSRIEFELEKFWAKKIVESSFPEVIFKAFPFFYDYQNLIFEESAMIPAIPARVVFLGSGPLPISAILYARITKTQQVYCVDSDVYACALSEKVIDSLNMSGKINIVNSNANNFIEKSIDVIFSAALVDDFDVYKAPILNNSRFLVLRNGEGVAQFIYNKKPDIDNIYTCIAAVKNKEKKLVTSKLYKIESAGVAL